MTKLTESKKNGGRNVWENRKLQYRVKLEIKKERAVEDIDYNNCECDEDYIVYGCYADDETDC